MLFTPSQERDFVLIIRYKVGSLDQTKPVGEITQVNKILGCFVLLPGVHCKKIKKIKQ